MFFFVSPKQVKSQCLSLSQFIEHGPFLSGMEAIARLGISLDDFPWLSHPQKEWNVNPCQKWVIHFLASFCGFTLNNHYMFNRWIKPSISMGHYHSYVRQQGGTTPII